MFNLSKIIHLTKSLNQLNTNINKLQKTLNQCASKQKIINQKMNVGLVRAIKTFIPTYFLIKPRPKKISKIHLIYRFYEVFKILK